MNILISCAFPREAVDHSFFLNHDINVVYIDDEKKDFSFDPSVINAVICNGLFLYHDISAFTSLKYIQLTSSGTDRVPLDYCQKNNIVVKNAKGVYSIPMSEFLICCLLDVLKESSFFERNRKTHTWLKNRNLQELFGQNVLIVGCGSVGSECAKRLLAFGCNVFGVDLMNSSRLGFEKIYSFEEIDFALCKADIVVLTVPLTDKTYHLINRERIQCFKEGSILINISRGGVVETEALLEQRGRFKAIILDVFEKEPLDSNSNLWSGDNIFVYPHNSFVGNHNVERLSTLIYSNLEEYLKAVK